MAPWYHLLTAPQMAKDQALPEHRWQGRHVLYFGDNLYRYDQGETIGALVAVVLTSLAFVCVGIGEPA